MAHSVGKGGVSQARVTFAVALAAPDAGADGALVPGRPFTIFPPGDTPAIDGRLVRFTDSDGAVLLGSLTPGEDLPVTYEHERDARRGGEAAGWMSQFSTAGGLRCERVEWTQDAAAEIRAGKWRYISGDAFGEFDPDGAFRPRRLLAATLTNKPALRGMGGVRLSAAEGARFAFVPAAPAAPIDQKEHEQMPEDTPKGTPEPAADERFAVLTASVAALTERLTTAEKTLADERAAFAAERDAHAATERQRTVDTVVEQAVRDGKVTVASRAAFAAVAALDPDKARALVASLPRIAPVKAVLAAEPVSVDGPIDLTTEEGRKDAASRAQALAAKEGIAFSAALSKLLAAGRS